MCNVKTYISFKRKVNWLGRTSRAFSPAMKNYGVDEEYQTRGSRHRTRMPLSMPEYVPQCISGRDAKFSFVDPINHDYGRLGVLM